MIILHQQLQLLLHRRRRLLELRESHLDCAIEAAAAAHSRRGVARNEDNDRNPLVSSRSLVCCEIGASKPPPPPQQPAYATGATGGNTRSAICSPSSVVGHPFAGPPKDVGKGAIALLQLVASGCGKCKRLVRRAREEGRAAQVRTSERANEQTSRTRTRELLSLMPSAQQLYELAAEFDRLSLSHTNAHTAGVQLFIQRVEHHERGSAAGGDAERSSFQADNPFWPLRRRRRLRPRILMLACERAGAGRSGAKPSEPSRAERSGGESSL